MENIKQMIRPSRLLILGLMIAVLTLGLNTVFASHDGASDSLDIKIDKVDLALKNPYLAISPC